MSRNRKLQTRLFRKRRKERDKKKFRIDNLCFISNYKKEEVKGDLALRAKYMDAGVIYDEILARHLPEIFMPRKKAFRYHIPNKIKNSFDRKLRKDIRSKEKRDEPRT